MAETRERPVLTPVKFAQEFSELFPPARALQLLGFCVAYRVAGYPHPRRLAGAGRTIFGLKRSAVYGCLVDLRRFRLHLVRKGYELAGLTDEAGNTYEQGIEAFGQSVDRQMVDVVVTNVRDAGHGAGSVATV